MYKTHKRLVDADDEAVLWKYMNFTSFYRMLLTGALFFKRLDNYTDDLEGTLHDQTREALYEYQLEKQDSAEEADKWLMQTMDDIESYKAFTLANAWSLNHEESYAMWKIYLHGHNEGIAIKTTVQNLKDCLNENKQFDIYSGKVGYEPIHYRDISIFTIACNKRQTYSYENEYRALIFNQYKMSEKNGRKRKVPKFDVGVDVQTDLKKLIDEVLVSPFAEPWFDDVVKSALKQLLPSFDLQKVRGSIIKDK
jgi:hypothetical protein